MAWSVKGMGDSHCSLINCKKDISLNTFFVMAKHKAIYQHAYHKDTRLPHCFAYRFAKR
jgi:hypothetical protein